MKETRTEFIIIRVSKKEKQEKLREASKKKKNISQYIRNLIGLE